MAGDGSARAQQLGKTVEGGTGQRVLVMVARLVPGEYPVDSS